MNDIPTAAWARQESNRDRYEDAMDSIANGIKIQVRLRVREFWYSTSSINRETTERITNTLFDLGYRVEKVNDIIKITW